MFDYRALVILMTLMDHCELSLYELSVKVSLPIKEVKEGAVNDIVKLEIEDGVIISSTISMEAVKDLNLKVGNTAVAIVKSTSVMLGEEE